MSGSTPYCVKGVHRAGAAEVGLHLVEDEDDVVLAAESFEQLQVFFLRMIRAAAAQVGLGHQAADALAELGRERGQLVLDTAPGRAARDVARRLRTPRSES